MEPLWGLYDINGKVIELGSLGDADVDIESQATSAFQYLRQVRKEASIVPEVMTSNLSHLRVTSNQDQQKECLPSVLTPVVETFLPSARLERWHASQFAQLCQRILREKSIHNTEDEINIDLPLKGDERSWFIFCYGTNVFEFSNNTSCDEENHENKKIPHNPSLDVMLCLSQPLVVQLLQYHLRWLIKHGLTLEMAQWMYALLVCLEKPLIADISSLLRSIAKRLADLRASMETPEDDRLPMINVLVSIIVRYFGQADLVN